MRRRVVAGALAAVGALLAALAPGAQGAASFLSVGRVGGPSGLAQIVDAAGREVLLKGVNVDGLVDYFRADLARSYPIAPAAYANGACPADDPTVEGVDICRYDFSQLAPLGYDVIRLNISWSLLEPTPGSVDATYLDRVAQVVGWQGKRGCTS